MIVHISSKEGPDEPLLRAFGVRLRNQWYIYSLECQIDSTWSDETAQMRRLIWVFPVCTGSKDTCNLERASFRITRLNVASNANSLC